MELISFAVGLGAFLLALAGFIYSRVESKAAEGRSKGYADRQLETVTSEMKLFWKHVNNRAIHEESMDAKLISEKFRNVDERFKNMGSKIDELSVDVKAGRKAVHELREEMPTMLAKALDLYGGKGKGANA